MCGCGCDLVAEFARLQMAENETREATPAADPASNGSPGDASELDARQGLGPRSGASLLQRMMAVGSMLRAVVKMGRANVHDRIAAV